MSTNKPTKKIAKKGTPEVKNKYLQIRVSQIKHAEITKLAQSMDKTISEIVLEHFEKLMKQNAKK